MMLGGRSSCPGGNIYVWPFSPPARQCHGCLRLACSSGRQTGGWSVLSLSMPWELWTDQPKRTALLASSRKESNKHWARKSTRMRASFHLMATFQKHPFLWQNLEHVVVERPLLSPNLENRAFSESSRLPTFSKWTSVPFSVQHTVWSIKDKHSSRSLPLFCLLYIWSVDYLICSSKGPFEALWHATGKILTLFSLLVYTLYAG